MNDKGRAADRPAERRVAELPDMGAMVDEHGRPPGVPSRTGTGSTAPPADPERVERAVGDPPAEARPSGRGGERRGER
ncbi:hypothetical protein ACFWCB_19575 [Streptomyces sp. NPDC060048]|uniref:hypothetical protein n=1 Tax=unclassified Streptomyces TaxID=2593676 RepID=UPI00368F8C01